MTLSQWADLATIIGALAVAAASVQVFFGYKQFKADHERSRREKTVELLTQFFSKQEKKDPIARRIIESLNVEQCRDILAQQQVTISTKSKVLVDQLFDDIKEENNSITLTESQSVELRWLAVNYLNSLEILLIAWQYTIVDRNIIETQFNYLFKPSEGHEILKEFRTAAGGEDTFPAIEIFVAHIQAERRKKLIQKSAVA